ncbi:hypothetical protein ACWEKT_23685 [Nocardia takedensis]
MFRNVRRPRPFGVSRAGVVTVVASGDRVRGLAPDLPPGPVLDGARRCGE